MPTAGATLVFGVIVALLEDFLFRHSEDMVYGLILLIVLTPTPLQLFFRQPVDIRAHEASAFAISVSFYYPEPIFKCHSGLIHVLREPFDGSA